MVLQVLVALVARVVLRAIMVLVAFVALVARVALVPLIATAALVAFLALLAMVLVALIALAFLKALALVALAIVPRRLCRPSRPPSVALAPLQPSFHSSSRYIPTISITLDVSSKVVERTEPSRTDRRGVERSQARDVAAVCSGGVGLDVGCVVGVWVGEVSEVSEVGVWVAEAWVCEV